MTIENNNWRDELEKNHRDGDSSFRREKKSHRPRINRVDGGERPRYSKYNSENRDNNYNRNNNRERTSFSPRSEGGDSYRNNYSRNNTRSSYSSRDNRDSRSRNYSTDRGNSYGNRSRSYGSNRETGYSKNNYSSRDNNYSSRDNHSRNNYKPYGSNSSFRNEGRTFRKPVKRTSDYDPNAKYSKKKQIAYKEKFIDPNQPLRLNKYLANAGVCSRREADEFITAGVVSVNGVVVTELGTKVKRSDVVKFHEEPVTIERKMYVLLNKPKDCVTTSDDPQSRLTVLDLVKGACDERIYPVGRLDRNTTGVLLLTNDGELASKLTHPKYMKKKIYHVQTDKNVTKHDMEQIAAGISLDDGEIVADAIEYIDPERNNQIGIEIHSGKNRIVRRIFESLGYRVVKLDRVFFAGLTKKGLRRGQWRFLSQNEVNFLSMGSFE